MAEQIFGLVLLVAGGFGILSALLLSKGSRRTAPSDPIDPPSPLPKATISRIGPEREHKPVFVPIGEVPDDFCETCGSSPCEKQPPQ